MGNKGRRFPIEPLTRDECNRLLAAAGSSTTGKRHQALIVLLWRAQLRISESLSLTPHDLDRETFSIRIRHGKGDKSGVVGLDRLAWPIIDAWLDARSRLPGLTETSPLLCTWGGMPILPANCRQTMKTLGRRAGILKRVHAHGLRHTGAREMLREGLPITVIQAQLRHSSLSTTATYVRELDPMAVLTAMASRSWAAPSTSSPYVLPTERVTIAPNVAELMNL